MGLADPPDDEDAELFPDRRLMAGGVQRLDDLGVGVVVEQPVDLGHDGGIELVQIDGRLRTRQMQAPRDRKSVV